MILYDFSGSVHSTVYVDTSRTKSDDVSIEFLRTVFSEQFLNIKRKFGAEYGDITICLDTPGKEGYWRREYLPLYKLARKQRRESDFVDWDKVYTHVNQLVEEFREVLPYKIIGVERCEADDVIATLALNKPWKEEDTRSEAEKFFEDGDTYEKVLIVSNDKDFKQLHDIPNLVQFVPRDGVLVHEANPPRYLFEHVLKGDSSDSIPNVRNPNEIFSIEGHRQTPCTQKYIKECMDFGIPEQDKERYEINDKIINLRKIPKEYTDKILETYRNTSCNKNKMKMFMYYTQNNLKTIAESVDKF